MRAGHGNPASAARLVSRRNLLGGVAAAPLLAVLAGCTDSGNPTPTGSNGLPSGSTTPSPDPDESARARAIAASRGLVSAYEAATSVPVLATVISPLLADHRAHLDALGAEPSDEVATSPTLSGSPSASGSTVAATTTPPAADPAVIVAALIETEQASSAERTSDATGAVDGGLARLLASIAACQSVHVLLLRAGPGAEQQP